MEPIGVINAQFEASHLSGGEVATGTGVGYVTWAESEVFRECERETSEKVEFEPVACGGAKVGISLNGAQGVPDADVKIDFVQGAIAVVKIEVKVGVGLEDGALVLKGDAVENILTINIRTKVSGDARWDGSFYDGLDCFHRCTSKADQRESHDCGAEDGEFCEGLTHSIDKLNFSG